MEPEKVIDNAESKKRCMLDIINIIREMSPELFDHYKECNYALHRVGVHSPKVKGLMSLMASKQYESCRESRIRSGFNHVETMIRRKGEYGRDFHNFMCSIMHESI